jgi:PmbA protein
MSELPVLSNLDMLKQKELELRDVVQKTIDKAKQQGADEVFVSTSYGVQSKIAFEKGDYNLATRHEGEGLTITVHKNKSCGCASINALDPDLLDDAIDKALHLAKHSVPDEFISLAPKAIYPTLDLPTDPALAEMTMDALVQLTEGFVSKCLESEKISIDSASVEQSSGVRIIANSNGMLATEQHNGLNWSVMGMAIDDDDITSFDYMGDHSLILDNCAQKMNESAERFSQKLLQALGAKNGKSYCGKVLLCPALVEELLLDPLIYHIMGSNIMDEKSRWADAIGTCITNSAITLEDHPHDPSMRGCTAFSGDGIPTKKMTVIQDG